MAIITKEELLKLAQLSCIKLEDDEVEPLRASIEAVLGYASRLKDVAAQHKDVTQQAVATNIVRTDEALVCTEPLVNYASVHENNYFVVPVIIKQ